MGKTTTAINLAASLALADRTVLLVDVDPQANLTSGVGMRDQVTAEPLHLRRRSPPPDVDGDLAPFVLQTAIAGLSTSSRPTATSPAPRSRWSACSRASSASAACSARSRERYNYVFIDCPPSLGLLTLNALVAADAVLIPLHCEYFALEGLAELIATMRRVRAALNPGARHRGRAADDVRRADQPGAAGGARRARVLQGEDVHHGHPAQRAPRRGAEPRDARRRCTTCGRAAPRPTSRSPASSSNATRRHAVATGARMTEGNPGCLLVVASAGSACPSGRVSPGSESCRESQWSKNDLRLARA